MSAITVLQIVKQGKVEKVVKTLKLAPAKFKEVNTTDAKRKKFAAGRKVNVRVDGKKLSYRAPKEKSAAA